MAICFSNYVQVGTGRDWKTQLRDNEITIDYEKMQKCFHRMFDTSSYILYTSFWLYVTYAVFMICTKSFLLPMSYVVFLISNELITLRTRLNEFNSSKFNLPLSVCNLVDDPSLGEEGGSRLTCHHHQAIAESLKVPDPSPSRI